MTDHYTYRNHLVPRGRASTLGLCAEFPSLSWLAPTPDEALSGIRELVGDVLADMKVSGESPPEPLADRTYSGRFVVAGAARDPP